MIREVNLQSYLPLFMREYQEIAATLDAENPEFRLIWDATNRVLYNEFIATADEYGISRFEKILGILPYKEDTLESRRSRVFSQWFNEVPYTMKVLIARMIALCGDGNFTITPDFEHYTLIVNVELEMFGQVDELERLFETMIPCNMIVISTNEISCEIISSMFLGSGMCVAHYFEITNDMTAYPIITGNANIGGGFAITGDYTITNDFEEHKLINNNLYLGSSPINSVTAVLTNDLIIDRIEIKSKNNVISGVVNADIVITTD